MNNNNYTSSYNAAAWRGRVADFIFDPLDAWLLISLVIIYIASMFVLYSADGQSWGQLERKTIYTLLAFFAMWFIARFRPVFISRFALPLYIVGLLMLIAVQVAGVTVPARPRGRCTRRSTFCPAVPPAISRAFAAKPATPPATAI